MLPDPLEERLARRQAAARARAERLRAVVPRLAAKLRARGATRIVLFGSLATGAEPHAGTDVDLCAFGLDEGVCAEASMELAALCEARVDVVCGERAGERVRAAVARDGVEVTGDAA